MYESYDDKQCMNRTTKNNVWIVRWTMYESDDEQCMNRTMNNVWIGRWTMYGSDDEQCMNRTMNNVWIGRWTIYGSDDEQSEIEFYYPDRNRSNNNNTTIGICNVCCLKRHIMKLSLTSIVWPLRENFKPLSFMYGPRPTGSVLNVKTSVRHFTVMTSLSANKKLILTRKLLNLKRVFFRVRFLYSCCQYRQNSAFVGSSFLKNM